jgi:plasmid replication initiation protein
MKKSHLPQIFKPIKTPKIYKNKKLNTANFADFTYNDYQVFLNLISKIGGVDKYGKYLQPEQLKREHVLTAQEFSGVFKSDLSNSYKFLHKACKKLMGSSITLEKLELSEIWQINICSKAEYNEKKGTIAIQFTDSIMPYLSQVKERFILYNLKEISNFGSLYTTRLYELIQEFKETGWMLKSVEQLRESFAVGNALKLYADFKKKTFAHACQEINYTYNIGLRFEELKEGRKVVAVKFFFKKTIVHKVVNQQTGKVTNVYSKPKALVKSQVKIPRKTAQRLPTTSDIVEEQLASKDSTSNATPVKNILSSLLARFNLSKK